MKAKTMFNIIIPIAIGLIALVRTFISVPISDIWDDVGQKFGATSFPTSLDALTNPSGTDSVATVSHSGQHSNANDAIEAIEAKVGIGASTAVTNSLFVGNGAGSSLWTTYGTSTNFTINNLGTFGSFISNASSTIVGGLTITGNSTTTNATSTIGAFTSFATSTSYYGAGLSTCQTGNVLTWNGGLFGCEADDAGGGAPSNNYFATSSASANLYILSIPMTPGDQLKIWASVSQACNTLNTASLRVRPTNFNASTTVFRTSCNGAGSDADNLSLLGSWTSTTTVNVHVDVTSDSGDGGYWSSLMVERVDSI